MLRDGWRGIVDDSGSPVDDRFMLRVFCSRLSMRAEQSSIVRERTSVSVWLMQPTDVNSVYGLHWYASVVEVVCFKPCSFFNLRLVSKLSQRVRRYTAIEPKCDKELGLGV